MCIIDYENYDYGRAQWVKYGTRCKIQSLAQHIDLDNFWKICCQNNEITLKFQSSVTHSKHITKID